MIGKSHKICEFEVTIYTRDVDYNQKKRKVAWPIFIFTLNERIIL